MPRPGIPDRDRPPRLFPLPRRGGHDFYNTAMTTAQRKALQMLRTADHPGIVTTSRSAMYDGQPWIYWRTAHALERLGVVTIAEYDEDDGYEVHLCEKGRP